jgi:hypothetical protein
MKQIIFGAAIALLLSGFFVKQAFGTNGGIAGSVTVVLVQVVKQ